MQHIAILGAGKIGCLISLLLTSHTDYKISLLDISNNGADLLLLQSRTKFDSFHQLDVTDDIIMKNFIRDQGVTAIVSCLPFFLNAKVALLAAKAPCHYFDLTEDINVTKQIKALSEDQRKAFVPQCGLAPGMIGLKANSLLQQFDDVEMVQMRVGALPQQSNNGLFYALTWSTDGLINEYDNPCVALENYKITQRNPLENHEKIIIDGCEYEAFNTSGGLGSLPELYQDKIKHMNYKSIRYPGHCEKMRFLMRDLKLSEDKPLLKQIFEKAIARSNQDVVLFYVQVTGQRNNQYLREHHITKIYPQFIQDIEWSGIQIATASGLCCVLQEVLANEEKYRGFVHQELIPYENIQGLSLNYYEQ